MRGQGEARTIVSVSPHDTAAFGVAGGREEVQEHLHQRCRTSRCFRSRATTSRRTWRTGSSSAAACSSTPACAANGCARPRFRPTAFRGRRSRRARIARANPKVSAAYVARRGHAPACLVRHGTAAAQRLRTGIHRQSGAQAGAHPQRGCGSRTAVRSGRRWTRTYFYNRFYDLIVTLGGSLSVAEPLHVGESGQLAGAGRGVFGARCGRRAGCC